MNPMTLLVLALTALVILFFVQQLYVVPRAQLSQTISRQLQIAMETPGKITGETMRLTPGMDISSRSLESDELDLSIECNDPRICCDENGRCPVRANSDILVVHNAVDAFVSVRCATREKLWVCRAFVGKKPAQLEIKKSTLSADQLDVNLKNNGDEPAWLSSATIEYLSTTEKNGEKTLESIEKKMVPAPFKGIQSGENKNWHMQLDRPNPGAFLVRITFDSLNAGQIQLEIPYSVERENSQCEINATTAPTLFQNPETNDIFERRPCQNCTLAFECRDAWKKQGFALAQTGTPDYAIVPQ